jgi:excinuclease ABC subunit A
VRSPRSTVGTLTELYDHLRLLFARLGTRAEGSGAEPPDESPRSRAKRGKRGFGGEGADSEIGAEGHIDRRLFSFNAPQGACPACHGLGVEDRIDPELLIADPSRTLREGALVPTQPNGYTVYSQVTVDALDQVCRAHGFSVDVPWRELTEEQRQVILRGSDRVRIPYGKHTLESRLRWSGITPKPREEGYYKGLLTVMEQTLARDRNKNILRFVRTMPCSACGGTRLRPEALAVRFHGENIAGLAARSLDSLGDWLRALQPEPREGPVFDPIRAAMLERIALLQRLGLGYLRLDRESTTLSAGEAQRLRIACQASGELRGILYVLDEPSMGLHPRDNRRLLEVLRLLRDQGNSVLVVEHDEETIRAADWLADLGPGAGSGGGELLYNGPAAGLLAPNPDPQLARSRTRACLLSPPAAPNARRPGTGTLRVPDARRHNLQGISPEFRLGALNVLTGVSGAGKSTLFEELLARWDGGELPGRERLEKAIVVDASPIGRTPRSNPATYTGLFDHVRDLFAALPDAKLRGFGKGRFSFNVAGGRCEACEGAGCQQIGMHFLGSFDVPCEACGGKRFNAETLEVKWQGLSIYDVLELSISRARELFADQPKIARVLDALDALGLGYLTLGQPSTTLSGGEAQRIKLAAELSRPSNGASLYLLDEPTTGLHRADVEVLLSCLQKLVERGDTVLAIEHDRDVIRAADWVIDLGPEGGEGGGRIVASGTPEEIAACEGSYTGTALRETPAAVPVSRPEPGPEAPIRLRGVRTHNLQGVDVEIPWGSLTVITGVSGSGKSSLAFDTLATEGQGRFTDAFSTYARRFVQRAGAPDFEQISGLTPAIAIRQKTGSRNPRSTVGTMTGILDLYRLLYSRAGAPFCPRCGSPIADAPCSCGFVPTRPLTAGLFSFNDERGACERCHGLGAVTECDPAKLITDPSKPLDGGAMAGHKPGAFYGDPLGRHMAILRAVGEAHGIDFSRPFEQLDGRARSLALEGTGDRVYQVVWHFRTKTKEGDQRFEAPWLGLLGYVNEEHARKHADRRAEALEPLMSVRACPACEGERLRPELRAVRFAGLGIGELCRMSVAESLKLFDRLEREDGLLEPAQRGLTAEARSEIVRRLQRLSDAGLSYLSLDRAASSLSGGEAQRTRLAAGLGSGLTGITYVLDEPTVGLHPRDTERLLGLLRGLRDLGNTVVVVEHDPEVILAADHVLDLGPGAGERGGRLVASGTPAEIINDAASATGRLLQWRSWSSAAPSSRRAARGTIEIRGANLHNLRDLDVDLPVGAITAVTGVSGSGKSTLVFDVLAASARAGAPRGCRSLRGLAAFSSVVEVDQSPVSGSSASTLASYAGLFERLRALFAATPVAHDRGWAKSFFSLASKGGRCEACEGAGTVRVSMDFLPDVELPCEECGGRRFSAEALEARVDGRSIADVLACSVEEALALFESDRELAPGLRLLADVGLGYLRLGQSTSSLSGGEAQRLKLAAELAKASGERNLYLFDEPTTGLHLQDVARLLELFGRLADAGHTLVIVEHNLEVVRAADWVVDLGPEGGAGGGRLVAAGAPEAIAEAQGSYTGEALRRRIARRAS